MTERGFSWGAFVDLWWGWKGRLLAGPAERTIGTWVIAAEGQAGIVVREEQDMGPGRSAQAGPPADVADIFGLLVASEDQFASGRDHDLAGLVLAQADLAAGASAVN